MYKRVRKVAAFTLLECLLALFVLSGSVLVFDGLTKLISQEIRTQSSSSEEDWLVFSEQLRKEWDGVRFEKVAGNRIYIQKGRQDLSFGLTKAGDFRKMNATGRGYQPMLYQVAQTQIEATGKRVIIVFQFQNGMERTFLYDFTEAS